MASAGHHHGGMEAKRHSWSRRPNFSGITGSSNANAGDDALESPRPCGVDIASQAERAGEFHQNDPVRPRGQRACRIEGGLAVDQLAP